MADRDLNPPEPQDPSSDPPALPDEVDQIRYVEFRYIAPLPPPGILRGYNEVLPGAAERIFDSFEKQGSHRQALEQQQLTAQIANQWRGQIFAFIIALVAIALSFMLVWRDKNVAGTLMFITTITGLVSVFIFGRTRQSQERRRIEEAQSKLLLAQRSEDQDEDEED